MSIKLMSMVFDAEGLSATQKLVMLAMCDYAADDGTSIYPSIGTLSRKTGLGASTIRKTIGELRNPDDLNLLIVSSKYTSRFPNRYAINIGALSIRVPPRSTLSATSKHPRVLPRSTDPSGEPPEEPPHGADAPNGKKPHPRNPMFDVLAEVCHLDPKVMGGRIGKTSAKLGDYQPDDVRRWYSPGGWWYAVRCKGLAAAPPPSPEGIEKTILLASESDIPKVTVIR